jgi:YihY family inner membrane protein
VIVSKRETRVAVIDVVRQTLRDVWAGNGMEWAAALAFYAVLCVFPLVLAGAALAAFVVEPSVVAARLSSLLEGFVPPGVIAVEPIITAAIAARRRVGLFAILVWLVAGRRLLGALVTALDRVSDVDERHESLHRRAAVEVVLLTGIGTLFVAALSARALLGLVWETLWGTGLAHPAAWLMGTAVHALLLVAGFYALYTVVPYGQRHRRAALAGAITATGLFLAVRAGFLAILDRLWESVTLIYGPLALAALLLTWAWVVALIVLFGGSLASHINAMLIEGSSAQEAEQRHVARKTGASLGN